VWTVKKGAALEVEEVTWTACTMIANFAICFMGWWRCFANNYLHWAAGTTWLLLIAQGNSALALRRSLSRRFFSLMGLSVPQSFNPCPSHSIRVSASQSVSQSFNPCPSHSIRTKN
jgi:hypothetical protein